MNRFLPTLALGLAVGLSGCDSFLEDVNPELSIDESLAFDDEATVNAILIGAYDELQQDLDDQIIFADLMAETAAHTGSFPSWSELDNYVYAPTNVEIGQQWFANYDLINVANNLIAGVPGVEDAGFSEGERNRVLAQAYTLRAFAYHNLIRWFGVRGGAGVPLVLTPTITVEDAADVERAAYSAVYDQIIADYEEADRLFGLATGAVPTGFINQNVTRALLARTLLYAERYEEASDVADQVIPNYSLAPLASIYEGLNSLDSIWEIQYNPDDQNSMSFFAFISGGRYEYGPTAPFSQSFSPADGRFQYNIRVGSQNRLQVAKYFRVNTDDDHHFLVRLPEMLFIKAEAAARAGEYDDAIELVNQVRARAYQEVDANDDGTPDVSLEDFLYSDADVADGDINSLDEALTIILNERRLELAFEGHRWHDLVRTGRALTVLAGNGLRDEFRTRWPIPQDELDANQLLEQNPGY